MQEPSFSLCKLADGEMKQSVRVNERGKSIMVVKREVKRREGAVAKPVEECGEDTWRGSGATFLWGYMACWISSNPYPCWVLLARSIARYS